ncbi:hypothetical protein FVEG_14846 [Fusarium verticillioides 7600]|uniref:Uncharacterized protein n=1 Tax=Gibberella moniliformis (strain M3125 / FGSC 7600) TaxID=334819 RepID=W7LRP9_GIBM7|nr:hypothetical protein FVEG_14846 [Fusarium verticillioides 7600]EWG38184.1 hypothetical protein FVEG_14846 [Fusarium verticillioides 7600]
MSPHKNRRNKKNYLLSCLTPFKRSDLIVAAIVKGETRMSRQIFTDEELRDWESRCRQGGYWLHRSEFARDAQSKSLLSWDWRQLRAGVSDLAMSCCYLKRDHPSINR